VALAQIMDDFIALPEITSVFRHNEAGLTRMFKFYCKN
jgi:hypothetical protein